MQVFFTNLGCKLNQAEVDKLARRFVAAGHHLAPRLEEAELHVVNSCSVTHLAARDSRKIARRGGRLVAGLRTVLTGCYATGASEEAAALAGVDLVVTNEHKEQLLERVHAAFPEIIPPSPAALSVPYVPLDFGHARALVKVEDGCNMRCSFCIIPSLRGRQRSRPLGEIVDEVQALSSGGYAEVVMTGVQISEYDDQGRRLYDLTRALLAQPATARLRLTSIAPWKFDHRLLDLWANPRLCRHFHMSLQSGSSRTLRRMRRPYSAAQYAELVQRIREQIPGVAITTDVIVGFPGESDEEFADSLAFVARMGFARPHLFTYSERPGTPAAELRDALPPAIKKERMAAFQQVAQQSDVAFRQSQLGATLGVVWEQRRGQRWSGLSDNYLRVFAESTEDLSGHHGQVRLLAIEDAGVSAQIV